ncbi:hypothetical protein AA313_de0200703 [Arthrobotrys entomopaga]|nr:hypothetical protein AA313_de0200703 [Arthrobotrys entomopaga]
MNISVKQKVFFFFFFRDWLHALLLLAFTSPLRRSRRFLLPKITILVEILLQVGPINLINILRHPPQFAVPINPQFLRPFINLFNNPLTITWCEIQHLFILLNQQSLTSKIFIRV